MSFWLFWAAEYAAYAVVHSLHKTALLAYHLPLHHSLLESQELEVLEICSAIKAIGLLGQPTFYRAIHANVFPISFQSHMVLFTG